MIAIDTVAALPIVSEAVRAPVQALQVLCNPDESCALDGTVSAMRLVCDSNRALARKWTWARITLLPVAYALRSGHCVFEPLGTAVDARLARQAHGRRPAQTERRDMDKQYCPQPTCPRRAAH
jgi:hypothetical protein